MPQVVIPISVSGNQVACNPDSVQLNRGDTIRWNYNGPFAVDFGLATPFPQSRYNGNGQVVTPAVRPDAASGTYKYAVAVYDGSQVLIADPRVIIP